MTLLTVGGLSAVRLCPAVLWCLVLNRHPYASGTRTDGADNALSACDFHGRRTGVEVVDIPRSLALWARFVSTRPGEGWLMIHAPYLPAHVLRHQAEAVPLLGRSRQTGEVRPANVMYV